MDKVRDKLPNAVFHSSPDFTDAVTALVLESTRHRAPIRRIQACGLFFQDGRPLSGCRAYRTSKERREDDRTREGTYTQVRSPRGSQGGQILSFRNKIIFRVRGPDLDDSSRS